MKKIMNGVKGWLSGHSGFAFYLTALLVAVLVLLNTVVYALTAKYQLYLYSPARDADIPLSETSDLYLERAMMGGRKVTVIFCDDRDDVRNHDLGGLVYDTAMRFEEKYPEFLEIKFVNYHTGYDSDDPMGQKVDLTKYNEGGTVRIRNTSIIFECEGNFRVMTGGSTGYEDFFSLTSGGSIYAYNGEEVLASMICWVTEPEDQHKKVYFTQNHGETADIALNSAFVSAGYYVEVINLRKQDVPEDAALVVISNPTTDFEKSAEESKVDAELDRLESYLEKGGNLYVVLDPLVKKLPNLEEFLLGKGFALAEDKDENGTVARDIVRDDINGDPTDVYRFLLTPASNEHADKVFGYMNRYVDGGISVSQTGRLLLSNGAVPLLLSSESSVASRAGAVVDSEGSYAIMGYNQIAYENGNTAQIIVIPTISLTTTTSMVNNTYQNKAFVLSMLSVFCDAVQSPIGCTSLITRGATLEGLTIGQARGYIAIVMAIPAALAVLGTVTIIRRKNR